MGLVDQGAEVNTPNLARYYPLYLACLNGRVKVCSFILFGHQHSFIILMVVFMVAW